MRTQFNFIRRSWAGLVACLGVALFLGFAATRSQADEWNKRTTLTISQPMQVNNTYLEPGSYVFKLVDSNSNRHIVQIFNADQTHLIATILAVPDYRVQVSGQSAFRMWETPAGYVNALRSWYYPGDNFGQEFAYPKNLRKIEVAQLQPPPARPAPVAAAPAPPPAPQEQAVVVEEQRTVIAQATPPPPPEAPAPAPAPALPQTASPYPLFGFIGLTLLGLGGLIRVTRSA